MVLQEDPPWLQIQCKVHARARVGRDGAEHAACCCGRGRRSWGGGPSAARSPTLHTILPDTLGGFLLLLQRFQCSRASEQELGALLSPPASPSLGQ